MKRECLARHSNPFITLLFVFHPSISATTVYFIKQTTLSSTLTSPRR